MKFALLAAAAAAFVAGSVSAQTPTGKMGELRPDQKQFFDLYKQLVETDTSITSVGNADKEIFRKDYTRVKPSENLLCKNI